MVAVTGTVVAAAVVVVVAAVEVVAVEGHVVAVEGHVVAVEGQVVAVEGQVGGAKKVQQEAGGHISFSPALPAASISRSKAPEETLRPWRRRR